MNLLIGDHYSIVAIFSHTKKMKTIFSSLFSNFQTKKKKDIKREASLYGGRESKTRK